MKALLKNLWGTTLGSVMEIPTWAFIGEIAIFGSFMWYIGALTGATSKEIDDTTKAIEETREKVKNSKWVTVS